MVCASLGPTSWDSLSFLDFLEVYFLYHIGDVLFHYLFKEVFIFLVFLFSFWHPYDSYVGTFKNKFYKIVISYYSITFYLLTCGIHLSLNSMMVRNILFHASIIYEKNWKMCSGIAILILA